MPEAALSGPRRVCFRQIGYSERDGEKRELADVFQDRHLRQHIAIDNLVYGIPGPADTIVERAGYALRE